MYCIVTIALWGFFLMDLHNAGFNINSCGPPINCKSLKENNEATEMAAVHETGPRTKHIINIKYRHFTEVTNELFIKIYRIDTKRNQANIFIKSWYESTWKYNWTFLICIQPIPILHRLRRIVSRTAIASVNSFIDTTLNHKQYESRKILNW